MTIYRDGQAIELTKEELEQAYREEQVQYYIDEVEWQLQEYHNIDAVEDGIDCKKIAYDVMDLIANDDTHWYCEQEAFRIAIRQYLNNKEA